MLSDRATLDLPYTITRRVAAWLRAHRQAHDRRPWQRAAVCWTQAIMFCRWMITRQPLSTGWRVITACRRPPATATTLEALDVVADHRSDLHEALCPAPSFLSGRL